MHLGRGSVLKVGENEAGAFGAGQKSTHLPSLNRPALYFFGTLLVMSKIFLTLLLAISLLPLGYLVQAQEFDVVDTAVPETVSDRFLIPQSEVSQILLEEIQDESGDDLQIEIYEEAEVVAVTLTEETKELVMETVNEQAIETVQFFRPLLESSTAAFGAGTPLAAGYDGSGYAVVVIDTGIDAGHAFLNVIEEACFSNGVVVDGVTTVSTCPGGVTTVSGSGSAATCQTGDLSGCTHGNHAAGVAAGVTTDVAGRYGVASGSEIIGVNVFTRVEDTSICSPASSPCLLATTEDLIAGLDHVLFLHNSETFATPIASVNLSLGGGLYSDVSVCEAQNASTKTAVDNLVAAGIAVIAAAGNDASGTQIAAPACISSVVAVGSVNDTDTTSSFSNLNALVDFVAPGEFITSAAAIGAYQTLSGTSFSTPHVSGAWAVLKQLLPNLTSSQISTELAADAVSVTDERIGGSGLVFARPDLAATFNRLFTPPSISFTVPSDVGVGTITDTTIQITDSDGILASDVSIAEVSSAAVYDLTCLQTDAAIVDCSVVIASDGDLGITASDANNFSITTSQAGYTVTNTAPVITITAPTLLGDDQVSDTTISVADNIGIAVADVTIDAVTTTATSNFVCTQTSARQVDCTVTITSSGDLVIAATDSVLNSTATQDSYVITETGPAITFLAPTKSANSTISDATISVTDPDGILAADVSIDGSSSALATLESCVQTDANTVDCTLSITSSGDLVIAAIDQVASPNSVTETGFVIDTTAPVIAQTVPTASSSVDISDTTIQITDDLAIQAAGVLVDAATTAGTNSFFCTQTDTITIDCTITITSSGDLVITAADDLGNVTSTTIGNYTITPVSSSGGGGGGGSPRPKACKDPEALNYDDSRRTRKDNDLCQYEVTPADQVTFLRPLGPEASTQERLQQIMRILQVLQLLRQLLASS